MKNDRPPTCKIEIFVTINCEFSLSRLRVQWATEQDRCIEHGNGYLAEGVVLTRGAQKSACAAAFHTYVQCCRAREQICYASKRLPNIFEQNQRKSYCTSLNSPRTGYLARAERKNSRTDYLARSEQNNSRTMRVRHYLGGRGSTFNSSIARIASQRAVIFF